MTGLTIKVAGKKTASTESVNVNDPYYITNTIKRLEVFSDKGLRNVEEIKAALVKYKFALAERQYNAMFKWLNK